jgi:predicted GH43/DUF377 family glycosyl hydrolase
VLQPEERWEKPYGCEDPRIVKIEDTFYLTYTAYDGKVARLAMAETRDPSLKRWSKRRLLLTDEQWDRYFPQHERRDTPRGWSKSGAILSEQVGGYWWMYFGDTHIWAACSRDLKKWEVIPDPVLSPRPGYFDSYLVEPGPPPVLLPENDPLHRPAGIWLGYNGAQKTTRGLRYAFGQVLLDIHNPTRVLRRSVRPLLEPEAHYEKKGHVPNVVFATGLVQFQGKWLLYYGMADQRIGAAMCRVGPKG